MSGLTVTAVERSLAAARASAARERIADMLTRTVWTPCEVCGQQLGHMPGEDPAQCWGCLGRAATAAVDPLADPCESWPA